MKTIKGRNKKGKKYCGSVKEGGVLGIRNNGMGIMSSAERVNWCHSVYTRSAFESGSQMKDSFGDDWGEDCWQFVLSDNPMLESIMCL